MKKYDIAVIGAGSGGLVAALTANRRGARVALIEKNKIGGECTHYGCVPSKTLISSARLYHAMQNAESKGLPGLPSGQAAEFAQVMEHVDQVVQGVYANEQPEHFEDQGIDVYLHPSGAKFINEREIRISETVIQAEYTIIATGSSPRMAPHSGGESLRVLHNENFWDLRKQPKSIVFLGGGVISVELGQSLTRFGTEVAIIDRNDRILSAVDAEVGKLATDTLQQEGIRLLPNSEVTSCQMAEDGKIKITLNQKGQENELLAEEIFVALGRTPNTAGMKLEQAGVAYTDRGIQTNEYLQTSVPNIYACGDVTSPAKFTHMASYQAEICVSNILEGNHATNDLSVVPWAIFLEPEIGHVGLSEAEARDTVGEVNVFKVNTGSVDRFITERDTHGFLKVIMDQHNRILGADAIGAHAGEWIQFFTLAIRQKLTIDSLAEMIFIYPTFSEIVKKALSRYLRTQTSTKQAAFSGN